MKGVVDTREPDPIGTALSLGEQKGISETDIEHLPSGDILIGGVAFERKTWPDFVDSMVHGRLENQVQKMTMMYEHSYILVEGDYSDIENLTFSSINPDSVLGYAARLTADGSPVIPVSNTQKLIEVAVALARKHNEESTTTKIPEVVEVKGESPTVRMYAQIEGVGPTTAKALADKFHSVNSACRAEIDELMDVEGVGEKTAIHIHKTLLGGELVDE